MSAVRGRRLFLLASGLGGASALFGCKKDEAASGDDANVTATEDLMREHGVIRRMLVVYREAGARLRTKPSTVPLDALNKAANLFRRFGEDYHERQLEEGNIFPALKRAPGAAATAVDTLVVQHNVGREITDFVIAVTGAALSPSRAEPLAAALETFARMYEEHAALEDTLVFPAWKKTMNSKQLKDVSEMFDEIEHKTFGKDAFADAVAEIASVESAFGIDLGLFTAPPPPRL